LKRSCTRLKSRKRSKDREQVSALFAKTSFSGYLDGCLRLKRVRSMQHFTIYVILLGKRSEDANGRTKEGTELFGLGRKRMRPDRDG
jgi:hypothetical protein